MTHTWAHFCSSLPAADLAKRIAKAVPDGGKVLEIACGTGISTEHLWRALPPGSEIVATDLNEAMLDFAPSATWQSVKC